MYSWVPNRGRVWNSHIGWTFTLKRINVGCGINVLVGNFPKMLIVGDGMFPSNVWNLIKWFKTYFNIMKNQHFLLAKGWKIAKICVFQLRKIYYFLYYPNYSNRKTRYITKQDIAKKAADVCIATMIHFNISDMISLWW